MDIRFAERWISRCAALRVVDNRMDDRPTASLRVAHPLTTDLPTLPTTCPGSLATIFTESFKI